MSHLAEFSVRRAIDVLTLTLVTLREKQYPDALQLLRGAIVTIEDIQRLDAERDAAREHDTERPPSDVAHPLVTACRAADKARRAETSMLTSREVAQRLRVSDQQIRTWARSGYIPASKPGKAYLFRERDIDAFVCAHERA